MIEPFDSSVDPGPEQSTHVVIRVFLAMRLGWVVSIRVIASNLVFITPILAIGVMFH